MSRFPCFHLLTDFSCFPVHVALFIIMHYDYVSATQHWPLWGQGDWRARRYAPFRWPGPQFPRPPPPPLGREVVAIATDFFSATPAKTSPCPHYVRVW